MTAGTAANGYLCAADRSLPVWVQPSPDALVEVRLYFREIGFDLLFNLFEINVADNYHFGIIRCIISLEEF